jgi:transposase
MELISIVQSRSLPAGYVMRAKLILMLAEGVTFAVIRDRLDTTNRTIIRWKNRFLTQGVEGLNTSHPGQKAYRLTASLRDVLPNTSRRIPPQCPPCDWLPLALQWTPY